MRKIHFSRSVVFLASLVISGFPFYVISLLSYFKIPWKGFGISQIWGKLILPSFLFSSTDQVSSIILIIADIAIWYFLFELMILFGFYWKANKLIKQYDDLERNRENIVVEFTVLRSSLLSSAPPILTALGILGTFLGISEGLKGINIKEISSATVMGAISPLLGGMSTAFNTSLLGIGFSIMIIVLDKIAREPLFRFFYNDLSASVLQKTAEGSEKEGMEGVLETLRESLEQTKKLVQIQEAQQKKATAEQSASSRLEAHLSKIREQVEEQARLMKGSQVEVLLQRLLEVLGEEKAIAEENRGYIGKFVEAIKILVAETRAVRNACEQMQQYILPLPEVLPKILIAQEKNTETAQEVLGYIQYLPLMRSEAFEFYGKQLTGQDMLHKGNENILGVLTDFRGDSQSHARQFHAHLREIQEPISLMNQRILEQSEILQGSLVVAESILVEQQGIRELQQEQNQSVATLRQEAQNANRTLSLLHGDVTAAAVELQTTARRAENILIEQQKAMESFETHLDRMADIYEESHKAMAEFEQNLQNFLGDMRKNLHEHRESFQEVSQAAVVQIERVGEQLQSVGEQATAIIDRANESIQATLQGVGDELVRTGERVTTELERFREAYSSALEGFFERQQELLEESLGRQREGIERVVLSLQDTLHEEQVAHQRLLQEHEEAAQRFIAQQEAAHRHHQETIHRLSRIVSDMPLILQQSASLIEENSSRQLVIAEQQREVFADLQNTVNIFRHHGGQLRDTFTEACKGFYHQVATVMGRGEDLMGRLTDAFRLHSEQMNRQLEESFKRFQSEITRANERSETFFSNTREQAQQWLADIWSEVENRHTSFMQQMGEEAAKVFEQFRLIAEFQAQNTAGLSEQMENLFTAARASQINGKLLSER